MKKKKYILAFLTILLVSNSCTLSKYFITDNQGVVIKSNLAKSWGNPNHALYTYYVEFGNGEILGILSDSTYYLGDTLILNQTP